MRRVGIWLLAAAGGLTAVGWAVGNRPKEGAGPTGADISDSVRKLDEHLVAHWSKKSVRQAAPANDLRFLRRVHLALHGSIPSLQQIREFEALAPEGRRALWVDRLLGDKRFAEYFAERLARAMVPLSGEPFLIYRRGRFVSWLSAQIEGNRPYDKIVRDVIASNGVWTDAPPVNFITGHVTSDNSVDPVRLASRTTRAFLGLRIDCAQCHDHKFAAWKQTDFHGLSAFYGQTKYDLLGVREDQSKHYEFEDVTTKKKQAVEPHVPFSPELLPSDGERRAQLAQWVTHPENKYFSKAIANRIWALVFGKPVVEPVDDLEQSESVPGVLNLLADDFVAHDHDLKRLLRTIIASQAFGLDCADQSQTESVFASFPVSRLRADQVGLSVIQSSWLTTPGKEWSLPYRVGDFVSWNDFVNRFGDPGEEEMQPRGGNIPQRLLLMNGEIAGNRTQSDFLKFYAAGKVARLAPDDESCVKTAYLVCLTRQPTAEELRYFAGTIDGAKGDDRNQRVEDLFWALLNSTEFSWNQ